MSLDTFKLLWHNINKLCMFTVGNKLVPFFTDNILFTILLDFYFRTGSNGLPGKQTTATYLRFTLILCLVYKRRSRTDAFFNPLQRPRQSKTKLYFLNCLKTTSPMKWFIDFSSQIHTNNQYINPRSRHLFVNVLDKTSFWL